MMKTAFGINILVIKGRNISGLSCMTKDLWGSFLMVLTWLWEYGCTHISNVLPWSIFNGKLLYRMYCLPSLLNLTHRMLIVVVKCSSVIKRNRIR